MSIFRQRTRSSAGNRPAVSESDDAPTSSSADPHPSDAKKGRLGFSDIANMFIRLRRLSTRAGVRPQREGARGSETDSVGETKEPVTPITKRRQPSPNHPPTTMLSSPPTSPVRMKTRRLSSGPYSRSPKPLKSKPHHIICSSGERVITDPSFTNALDPNFHAGPLEYWDTYECVGGVNVGTLLRATRTAIMEHVLRTSDANALVNEKWQSTICGPKHGVYRVQIRYWATPTLSSKPDPRRPVAIDQAKGIPGLMTILRRNDL